jgi:hypothetical protein
MRTPPKSCLICSPLLIVAALGLAACAHDGARGAATTRTTGATVSVDDAVGQLAKARCERDAQCNSLASDAFSASRGECVRFVREDEERQLNQATCRGVKKAQADKCIEILRGEECQAHMGRIETMLECAALQLCAP